MYKFCHDRPRRWIASVKLRRVLFSPLSSFLDEGERVIYETKKHPALVLPFVAVALALSLPTYLLSLVLLAFPLVQMKNGYVVTNKRIIAREGFILPRLFEIPLGEISCVGVGESLLGAKLGMGSVILRGGRDTLLLRGLKDPKSFLSHTKAAWEDLG
jgi:hypothetical protein